MKKIFASLGLMVSIVFLTAGCGTIGPNGLPLTSHSYNYEYHSGPYGAVATESVQNQYGVYQPVTIVQPVQFIVVPVHKEEHHRHWWNKDNNR